jgi:hypothetical protein
MNAKPSQTKEGMVMRTITDILWKKRVVRTFMTPMTLGLLLTGCLHHPLVKPIDEASPQDSQQEAVAYCKAKTTLSLKEKLDLIDQSKNTFGDAGQGAGNVSDLVAKDDDNSGAVIGRSIGETVGVIGALGALYHHAEAEEQHFQICLQDQGYMVSGL